MVYKIVQFVLRILAATVFAAIIMFIPPPVGLPGWLGAVQMPLTIFLLVVYIGVQLYDTLFYDHYKP